MARTASLRLALVTGSALLIAAPASADTLREALARAYEGNPTLTGARAQQRVLDENVPLAKADARPSANGQFAFQENFLRSANSFTAPLRQASAAGSIDVPIYQGGAVKNRILAARTRVDAGRFDLRATQASLFSNVVATYMNVIRDEAVVQLNRAQVGVLSVNLQATSDRFEIGDLTRTDVAQSEARLALANADLEQARANLIASKEDYIQLVGSAPGDLAPPPPLPGLPESPEQAVDLALVDNPDLLAARERIEASAFDIRVAEASARPRVSAFVEGSYVNFFDSLGGGGSGFAGARFVQEQSTAQAGVRATVPIYQGGRPAAQIRQAQAQLSVTQENAISVERNVIAQTRAAFSSFRASMRVIEASERAVAAAELSLEGVRAENTVGNRTILDILDAEQELLNAQVQLVSARRNSYVAGFSLLAAMGRAEARDLGLDGGALYDPTVNFERVEDIWYDFQTDPDPVPRASRTVATEPQDAEVVPLPRGAVTREIP